MARTPEDVTAGLEMYSQLTEARNRPPGQITVNTRLPLSDQAQSRKLCAHYQNLGVDRLVCGVAYNTIEEFCGQLEPLADLLQ
jgi:hypothetical protein